MVALLRARTCRKQPHSTPDLRGSVGGGTWPCSRGPTPLHAIGRDPALSRTASVLFYVRIEKRLVRGEGRPVGFRIGCPAVLFGVLCADPRSPDADERPEQVSGLPVRSFVGR